MTASRSNASDYGSKGIRFLFVGLFVLLPFAALLCNGPDRVRQFDGASF